MLVLFTSVLVTVFWLGLADDATSDAASTQSAHSSYLDLVLVQYQKEIVAVIVTFTAGIIVYIIKTHAAVKPPFKKPEFVERRPSTIARLFGKDSTTHDIAEEEEEVVERTIKKSISFNTVYNLEEFMVRLYKIGFFVVRLKPDGSRKERFVSIDQKGNLCFHKLATVAPDELPRRYPSPYIKLPVKKLRECFACEDSPEPSFILDFKSKTLHLAVSSLSDRDYIVKGIKLIVQRAKTNSNFLLRSGSLMDSAHDYDEGMRTEDEADDMDDTMTQTTMNTSFTRR